MIAPRARGSAIVAFSDATRGSAGSETSSAVPRRPSASTIVPEVTHEWFAGVFERHADRLDWAPVGL